MNRYTNIVLTTIVLVLVAQQIITSRQLAEIDRGIFLAARAPEYQQVVLCQRLQNTVGIHYTECDGPIKAEVSGSVAVENPTGLNNILGTPLRVEIVPSPFSVPR